MIKIIIISVFFITSFTSNLYSQNAQKFGTMTEQEKKDFIRRSKDMFDDFKFALKIIPRFNDNKLKKNKLIRNTLRNFIPNAKIEIALSKNHDDDKSYSIEVYLKNELKDYSKRSLKLVEIEVIDFNISNKLTKHATIPNAYILKYSFTQKFSVSKPSKIRNAEGLIVYDSYYIDITKKSGEIIIKKENNILGTKWISKMGDIKVESYTKLK